MKDEDLLRQLQVLTVERRPEACLGCGLEHNCSLKGCAATGEALRRLRIYADVGIAPEDLKAAFSEESAIKLTAQYFGLTPERLTELCKAEKDGRALIAEYPIGTPVYKLTHGTKVETRIIDGVEYRRDVSADYVTVHLYDFVDAMVRAENPEHAQTRYARLYLDRLEAEAALREPEGQE